MKERKQETRITSYLGIGSKVDILLSQLMVLRKKQILITLEKQKLIENIHYGVYDTNLCATHFYANFVLKEYLTAANVPKMFLQMLRIIK